MRVAIVHDLLVQWGGAERVLASLATLFPDAPIYTLLYDEALIDSRFSGRDVRASFLQQLPWWLRARYRWLYPFMPYAASRLPVGEFDLIISSSSAFAKGVRPGTHAVHVCYCHAPSRFLWDDLVRYQTINRLHAFVRLMITALAYPLRLIDVRAAERVDIWIANSKTTQERIKRIYKKPAAVVYPPVTDFAERGRGYSPHAKGENGYFLVVSRLSAFKKIDVIVRAFSLLNMPLVVVGAGAELERLRSIAGVTVTFTGFVSDEKLADYYAGCRAFVAVCDDDFGMSAVEALYFGKPILAYRKGGVTEWMEEGKTGIYIEAQTAEAVCDAVEKFRKGERLFDPEHSREKAAEFSEKRFCEYIMRLLPR